MEPRLSAAIGLAPAVSAALGLALALSACAVATPPASVARPTVPGPRSTDQPQFLASPLVGAGLFAAHCVPCHGDAGRGDGPRSALLVDRPPDFTDTGYMSRQRPGYYERSVRVGVPGSAMPRWDHILSDTERWDVAMYAWSLGAPDGARDRGSELYAGQCAKCHGPSGNGGTGPALAGADLAERSRTDLIASMRAAHPDLVDDLSLNESQDLVEGIFGFLYEHPSGR